MGIVLQKNTSLENVINKSVSNIGNISSWRAVDSVNVLAPVLFIERGSLTNAEVLSCNYLYISEFGRFYFVKNIEAVNESTFRLDCSVDVLYTYRARILNIEGLIERSTNNCNHYLTDSIPVETSPAVSVIEFTPISYEAGAAYIITTG